MVSKGSAIALASFGVLFVLVGGILVGSTGFLDNTDEDYMDNMQLMAALSVILFTLGLAILTVGFVYVGVAAENNYLKIGAFFFASVALYVLMKAVSAA